MRIGIVGAGGIGGVLAMALGDTGDAPVLMARGAHGAAIAAHGLVIETPDGAARQAAFPVLSPEEDDGRRCDLLIFAVKLYDTEGAARASRHLLAEDGLVVTLQNGVESEALLSPIYGAGRVLPGAAWFNAWVAAPGRLTMASERAFIQIAAPDPESGPVATLAERLRAGGVLVELATDGDRLIWHKFALLSAASAVCGLTRQPMGVCREDPDIRPLFRACAAETGAVGRALGVDLRADLEDWVMQRVDRNPADGKASQLIDLEQGKPLELDWFSGAIRRLGRAHGVPTPVHDTVYAALKPYRRGAPA